MSINDVDATEVVLYFNIHDYRNEEIQSIRAVKTKDMSEYLMKQRYAYRVRHFKPMRALYMANLSRHLDYTRVSRVMSYWYSGHQSRPCHCR